MIYKVIGFVGTGFNAVNFPSDASVFPAASRREFDAIDVVQPFGLKSIQIKATLEEVEDLDYIMIGEEGTAGEYYACGAPVMVAEDVALLPLEENHILSVSLSNISFLDGIVVRRSIKDAENTYGRFQTPDPYLTPAEPLVLTTGEIRFDDKPDTGMPEGNIVIEATIDLVEQGKTEEEGGMLADVYGEGEAQISVPHVYTNKYSSVKPKPKVGMKYYKLVGPSGNPQVATTYVASPGIDYFDGNDEHVAAGVARSREIGATEGVLAQYFLPSVFVEPVLRSIDNPGSEMIGDANFEQVSDLPFDYSAEYDYEVMNQRVLYGEYNRYVLSSMASGESAEYQPEDLYRFTGAAQKNPTVAVVCDPRSGGRPYFRYMYYRYSESWFANCVPGEKWQNVPLVFDMSEGRAIAKQRLQTRIENQRAAAGRQQERLVRNSVMSTINNALGAGQSYMSTAQRAENQYPSHGSLDFQGNPSYTTAAYNNMMQGAEMQMYGKALSSGMSAGNSFWEWGNINLQFEEWQREALENLALDYYVVAPTVYFPQSGTIRDFVSNGIIPSRYQYSENDLKRCDKILNMYGTKTGNESLTLDMLSGKKYYNYIEATGVSVGGNLPKWRREGIARQLSVGVRLWHVLPDKNLYVQPNTDAEV